MSKRVRITMEFVREDGTRYGEKYGAVITEGFADGATEQVAQKACDFVYERIDKSWPDFLEES